MASTVTNRTDGNIEKEADKLFLVPHSSMATIIRILEERLPRSANMYNTALYLSRHPGKFPLYTINGDLSPDAWVIAVHRDEGLNISQVITVSAPTNPRITEVIKQAFIDTAAIEWDKTYMFNCVDRALSPMIIKISSSVKKNTTTCYPNYYYTISREYALKLEILNTEVEIRPLKLPEGAEFVTKGWQYAAENSITYASDQIRQHPSCGVYINGQLVSAAITHDDFCVGMLTTDPNHRNKGYGLICMKALLKNLAKEGYVPSSCVHQKNSASNAVHIKAGMKVSHECDYIMTS